MAREPADEVEVVIVGAGIAGLASAVALRKVGAKRVVVLEKASELRVTGAAIGLFPNAWRALDALGVAHKLTPLYHGFQRGVVTNVLTGVSQELSFVGTISRGELSVRAVHRRVLLEALAEELPPGTIRFSSKLVSIKTQSSSVVVQLEDGSVIRAKVLIGCDGLHSVVARWLGLTDPVDSGRSAVRGLAVYPEGHGFKHEVRQFLGDGSKRTAFFPLNDKELFWFFTQISSPAENEIAGDPELIQKFVLENTSDNFPSSFLDVVGHADVGTLSWAPLMLRRPWDLLVGPTHQGCVVVAGDAMHPMTPDLGQGGCTALEDAVVLGRCLAGCFNIREKREEEVMVAAKGIEKYVRERRWRAAGLITGSYLAGRVQLGDSAGWWLLGRVVKFVRDNFFYRFVFPWVVNAVIHYDCGSLPVVHED